MNINFQIDNEKFRYDAYQIVKIFYPYDEITFGKDNPDYRIGIRDDKISIVHADAYWEYPLNENKSIKEQLKTAVYQYFSGILGINHPWGTLVGIRPTKIAALLIEQGLNKEEIISFYNEHYLTSEEKALLCIEVAQNEKKFLKQDRDKISIYVGMPFCPTRCAYCSFASNSIAGRGKLVQSYLEALKYEIDNMSQYLNEKGICVQNIYFGGGTPTSVSSEEFKDLMEKIHDAFMTDNDIVEFTVEAGRPDSINEEKLSAMLEFGVTRISINPQSMNDETLKKIGRIHTVEDVREKFHLARSMGFKNINMDIIVGLPGEGIAEVENTCREILKLEPESITVHGMSIKRASRLHEMLLNNEYTTGGLGIAELNSMFDMTRDTAESLDMVPYYLYRQKNMIGSMENIGYARKGYECAYNVKIMEENQVIVALGADAVTKVVFPEENRIERYANLKEVSEYVTRINEQINGKIELLNTLYGD
ncbi:MAG: coproporphyrinogen III oxidase [Bacillota bacterium]|nr:coproporphyrinogen III oxidase [Bacillota bacterium]